MLQVSKSCNTPLEYLDNLNNSSNIFCTIDILIFLKVFSMFDLQLWWDHQVCWVGIRRQVIQDFLSPSGDLGIGLVWDNHPTPPNWTGPVQTHFLVRLLKSYSSWTKLSKMGPQLFSGWYQMVLDVFRLFSDCFPIVFRLFSDCFPTVEILFKWNLDIYDGSSVVITVR